MDCQLGSALGGWQRIASAFLPGQQALGLEQEIKMKKLFVALGSDCCLPTQRTFMRITRSLLNSMPRRPSSLNATTQIIEVHHEKFRARRRTSNVAFRG